MIGRTRFLGLALVMAVAPATGMAQSSTAEIRHQLEHYVAGWGSLDVDRVSALYAKDADLLFFDVAPLKYTGWNAYANGAKSMLSDWKSLTIGPSADMTIHRNGNSGWSAGTMHLTGVTKKGETMQFDVRSTLVWEKRRGKWLIVHEHFSEFAEPKQK